MKCIEIAWDSTVSIAVLNMVTVRSNPALQSEVGILKKSSSEEGVSSLRTEVKVFPFAPNRALHHPSNSKISSQCQLKADCK